MSELRRAQRLRQTGSSEGYRAVEIVRVKWVSRGLSRIVVRRVRVRRG